MAAQSNKRVNQNNHGHGLSSPQNEKISLDKFVVQNLLFREFFLFGMAAMSLPLLFSD